MKPIVSIKEARDILGEDAVGMSDDDILQIINTLDLLAKDALDTARRKIRVKKDAKDLANVIYDIYQDSNVAPKHKH